LTSIYRNDIVYISSEIVSLASDLPDPCMLIEGG